MPTLIVETGPSAGTRFSFEQTAVIGRVAPADLVLDNPTVSRRHAMLRRLDRECSVVDLGSINGTFVDGRKVQRPTRIGDGAQLQFGAVRARFIDDAAPGPEPVEAVGTIDDTPGRTYERQVSMPASASTISAPVPAAPATTRAEQDLELATRLKVLDAVARFSCRVLDPASILSFVAEQVFTLLPQAERVLILKSTEDAGVMQPIVGRARDGRVTHTRMSRSLLAEVLTRQEGIIVTDVPADSVRSSQSMDQMEVRSLVCVPVVFDGTLYGVIHADTSSFTRRFDGRDLTLLLALASQAGMALAYARLHTELLQRQSVEHDLDFAKRLQRHFLPQRLPDIPGYDAAVHLGVAEKLGGDLYDVLQVDPQTYHVVVGDVCGKGVAAALYAAKLGADVRHAVVGQAAPAAVMDRLNRTLTLNEHEGMFVTVAIASIDVASHRLLLANAGHPQPLVRAADGRVTRTGPTGDVPLGVDDTATYAQRESRLEVGDALLFYSDGITEAMNAQAELYGDERLAEVVRRTTGSAHAVVEAVLADVSAFSHGLAQADDQTLFCLRRRT